MKLSYGLKKLEERLPGKWGWGDCLKRGLRKLSGVTLTPNLKEVSIVSVSVLVKTHQMLHLSFMHFTLCKFNL